MRQERTRGKRRDAHTYIPVFAKPPTHGRVVEAHLLRCERCTFLGSAVPAEVVGTRALCVGSLANTRVLVHRYPLLLRVLCLCRIGIISWCEINASTFITEAQILEGPVGQNSRRSSRAMVEKHLPVRVATDGTPAISFRSNTIFCFFVDWYIWGGDLLFVHL